MATLRDIMNPAVITLGADMSVAEAEDQLTRHHISGAPVLHGGRVVGVVSTRDLRAVHDARSRPDAGPVDVETPVPHVKDIMTRRVVSLPPAATVAEAADLMQHEHVHRVLVMQGEYLLGVVSTFDVARALNSATARATGAMRG